MFVGKIQVLVKLCHVATVAEFIPATATPPRYLRKYQQLENPGYGETVGTGL